MKLADEYRQKYLQLKNEYVYLKTTNKEFLKDSKIELETKFTKELTRLENFHQTEVNQYSKIASEQEHMISGLSEEAHGLQGKCNAQKHELE
jgi:hypothetical protein